MVSGVKCEKELPVAREEAQCVVQQANNFRLFPECEISDLDVKMKTAAPPMVFHRILRPSTHRAVCTIDVRSNFEQIEDSVGQMKHRLNKVRQFDPNIL